MKLYYSPNACSLSPHIVLRESGLPFDLEKVDLKTKKTETGQDFMQINQKGYVPALVCENGELLTEGPAIVQYIADRVPEKKLAPENGSFERYRLQQWLNFIGTEVHKGFGPLFNEKTPEAYKQIATENLKKKFTYLNEHLSHQNFIMGETFSVADAYLFTVTRWSPKVKIDLSVWPSLTKFLVRIEQRPGVKAALEAEKR